jgi:hypothetical protein
MVGGQRQAIVVKAKEDYHAEDELLKLEMLLVELHRNWLKAYMSTFERATHPLKNPSSGLPGWGQLVMDLTKLDC